MISTRYNRKWDWKVYFMNWSPKMEGIILCDHRDFMITECFYDHRVLSRKYEAEKKNTDLKDMGFYVRMMIEL